MTGTVPQSLNALSSLRELHLAENSLSGSLPELDDLTQLRALHLDGNGFSGPLGGLLRSLAKSPLRSLGLSRNMLTGHLPGGSLEKLKSLESFRIGGNQLDGPFPVHPWRSSPTSRTSRSGATPLRATLLFSWTRRPPP